MWIKKIIVKILLAQILVIFASELKSEEFHLQEQDSLEKSKWGIFGAFSLNYQTANINSLNIIPSCCQNKMSGDDSGFNLGVVLDYPFSSLYGVQIRLSYFEFNSAMQQIEPIPVMKFNNESQNYEQVEGEFSYNLNSIFRNISVNANFTYLLTDNLYMLSGFVINYFIDANFEYYEKIENPIGGFFVGTERSPIQNEKEAQFDSDLFYSLNLGFSYQLQMNSDSSLFLCPEVNYKYILPTIVKDASWDMHSIGAGLAIKYMQPPPPPPPPLPPIDAPLPPYPWINSPSSIIADINAVQIDSTNKINETVDIKIEDFVSHTMSPLLNYVFFDESSSEIPDRYKKYSKDEISNFRLDSLRKLDVLETYYQILNIIGYRLKLDEDAEITLIGTNSYTGEEKNNLKLSRNRALSVKDYLTEVWEINPRRIKILARHLPKDPSNVSEIEGQEENRRVEIESEDWKIVEPVIVVDTTRNIKKSTIRFYPSVESDIGLNSWNVEIRQNNQILKSFSGRNELKDSIDWKLSSEREDIPTSGDELRYQLIVSDSLGQYGFSENKILPVEQMTIERKRIEKKFDREFEYYSLIIFEYGRYKLRGEHRKVLEVIKDRLKKNSKVIITGHTDNMGKDVLNRRISLKRANAVAKQLKLPNVQIVGMGEENLLYDNSKPEGRFYCRTVKITIETPIENK